MTVEHKIVVGMEDLRSVIFECKNAQQNCKSRVGVSPDRGRNPPQCPNCGAEWVKYPLAPIEVNGTDFTKFIELLAAIRKQGAASSEWPKFRILLEFDEPELGNVQST